ncbi:cytosolic carboxypeptidase-like protein 5 [Daphnia magna]|uniref:cytosolic carboxypeptidase-like protein 5 n=1 Tax=Daphnia magna TaxID=35525 RepID=UPI001E1BBED4|nr:cytosolic carboxypeptidase-like protein 5 [Daphnia magna]XP_045034335.1 cytosolic carboxypeptidase-like protein 5 [Daphnia magna]XP_045034336.1 cytosolic carboxypeptidase-like protein 5 [Daphnia magna]XP_045034337.1 cytosolic carboxypeptidase-like protein 5 [Daphnia magna]XP_045034340.1 cytosolic carboxypeptidase-like protein 5 [Daphnia magna]
MNETIGSFHFHSDFDSGNLAKVVINEKNDNEFHLWTLPDCANTPYENGNRTWFYFGVKGPCDTVVKFNIMNLNRQAKLYSQGMKPLFKVHPHQEQWERIKDKPICSMEDQSFVLSFKFTMPSQENSTVYFAFCYPYSYSDLLFDLDTLDTRFSAKEGNIYFGRELLCNSLDQRRVDLVTVTRNGDENRRDKPVVFVSARVHPGETPSSFVLNGFLDFILKEDDIRAQKLRENFIFLLVPMLNPDGVYRGHYRTDSRGVNLNRVYLETDAILHPTIAATKQLLLDLAKEELVMETNSMSTLEKKVKETLLVQTDDSNCKDDSVTLWPLSFKDDGGRTNFAGLQFPNTSDETTLSLSSSTILSGSTLEGAEEGDVSAQYFDVAPATSCPAAAPSTKSRLFAYIDLHGHASKRGIFIYGNHFKDANQQVECLLLPKLISLNSQHFDFWACNFSEKNMRQRDKRDGLSKEGSGRVAVSKLTGIPRSYTLECNYNTGRMRNILSPLPTDKFPLFHATTGDAKDEERLDGSTLSRRRTVSAGPSLTDAFAPPVPYSEQSFKEVGEAIAVSLLDLIGANPMSRLPQSTYGDVDGARQWIRLHCLGQRRFPFVEADADEESTCSHLPSSSTTSNFLQQVSHRDSMAYPATSTATTGDLATTVMSLSLPAKRLSPGKRLPKSGEKTNRVRVRKPWPGSPRMKESPNQSPKQQGPSTVDFAPSSPSYQLFPKVKSPPSARRIPRKKSLRKAKVQPLVKKDGMIEVELNATFHATSPSSPPKQLLKRKRRKSRTQSVSESSKEKRKFKGSPVAVAAVAAAVVAASDNNSTEVDYPQPSTSASTRIQTKSVMVKKKKLLKKRNATSVLQKKKRINLIIE